VRPLRGFGLFNFQAERFELSESGYENVSEPRRTELLRAICEASKRAILEKIAPGDAVNRIRELEGVAKEYPFIVQLTELQYARMTIQILGGNSLVLVRGYADGERGPWQRDLAAPVEVQVHQPVDTTPADVDRDVDFAAAQTPKQLGHPEAGRIKYGNVDLPDLRAAAVADMIRTLVRSCPADPGLPALNQIELELLEGQVYSGFNAVDRKVRVYLMVYLKD